MSPDQATMSPDQGLVARRRPETLDLILSTVAVTALAVSQPLLDVLGRGPEFFVARGSSTFDVVLLASVVGIGIPLFVAGLVTAVGVVSRRAGSAVHVAVLVVSGALLALALLGHTPMQGWPAGALIALAAVAGVGLAIGYHRSGTMRSLLRYAAVAPIAVVGIFLVLAPTARLVWGSAGQAMAAGPVAQPAPFVMLVFDELPVATLIDETGEIRGDQFPAFARLAADGTWFRNAVGVHERTEEALPTILTGQLAQLDENVPTAVDYPDNLFTLLGPSYHVEAVESVTALCPPPVCVDESRPQLPFATRWRSLGGDLAVVAGHVFFPEDLASQLPPIDEGWGDFATARIPEDWALNRRFNEAVDADRRVGISALLDWFDLPLDDGELRFAHLLLPHAPWTLLPDGRSYEEPRVPPGEWTPWTDDAWLVAQAYQRHLLQTQYVDRVVGEVIRRLEASGSYRDTLVVVTADHGVAIRPGLERRIITHETVGDLAAVPLFVKLPGPPQGVVSDYRAESTDILPTIAAALGVEVPWQTAGVDLFAPDRPARATSTMLSSEGSVTFGTDGEEKLAVARYHEGWFGGGDPFLLAPPGQLDLLGAEVASLPTVEREAAVVTFDQPYPLADLPANVAPAVISGIIAGIPADQRVVAIAVDGWVVAVTRTWVGGGGVEFQAMIPSEVLDSRSVPVVYLVDGAGSDRTLTWVGG